MTCGVIIATPILTMEFVWFGKEATQRAGRVLRGVTTAGVSGLIEAAGQTSRSGDNPWCDLHTENDEPDPGTVLRRKRPMASGQHGYIRGRIGSENRFVAGPDGALLIICIGAALLLAAKANRVTAPIVFLALSAPLLWPGPILTHCSEALFGPFTCWMPSLKRFF